MSNDLDAEVSGEQPAGLVDTPLSGISAMSLYNAWREAWSIHIGGGEAEWEDLDEDEQLVWEAVLTEARS